MTNKISESQDDYINHRRVGNQFAQLGVEGGNLAAVPHEMRKDFNRKEIEGILSQDLDLVEKYNLIKDNPNLTSDDLLNILYIVDMHNIKGKLSLHPIINHFNTLNDQRIRQEYNLIKDNPSLTPGDLSKICSPIDLLDPANNDINLHYSRLMFGEGYNIIELLREKMKPDLTSVIDPHYLILDDQLLRQVITHSHVYHLPEIALEKSTNNSYSSVSFLRKFSA